jgi:uroporphyrin-III C-methyltransferase/precorrin-2 dehydrogenase/sirohydrochlorin ferrochelatase
LSVLPVFFNLNEQQVVVVGGTEAAAWKAELLAAAGAKVLLHAGELSAEMASLLHHQSEKIILRNQALFPSDIADAQMVVADAPNPQAARQIRAIAKLYGIPVNIIDQPEFCDFQFGSIVNRSPTVIAVSTSGAAPILGQAVRRRIEAILPTSLGAWSKLAMRMRDKVNQRFAPGHERRAFWEKFVDRVFQNNSVPPKDEDLFASSGPLQTKGKLIHIGYSPNDPEQISLKAVRALQSADKIYHPEDAPTLILELARREAARVTMTQSDAVRAEAETNIIVLKPGNPHLFEEIS